MRVSKGCAWKYFAGGGKYVICDGVLLGAKQHVGHGIRKRRELVSVDLSQGLDRPQPPQLQVLGREAQRQIFDIKHFFYLGAVAVVGSRFFFG